MSALEHDEEILREAREIIAEDDRLIAGGSTDDMFFASTHRRSRDNREALVNEIERQTKMAQDLERAISAMGEEIAGLNREIGELKAAQVVG